MLYFVLYFQVIELETRLQSGGLTVKCSTSTFASTISTCSTSTSTSYMLVHTYLYTDCLICHLQIHSSLAFKKTFHFYWNQLQVSFKVLR